MSHLPANEIAATTFYTIDKILEYGERGPLALVLYFKYMEQRLIQGNNQTLSLDRFMANKLKWSKRKLQYVKNILKELGLIDQITKKNDKGQIIGHYVRVNFMINNDKLKDNNISLEIEETHNAIGDIMDNKPTMQKTHNAIGDTWPCEVGCTQNTLIPNINTLIPKKENTLILKSETSSLYFSNSKINEVFIEFIEMRKKIKKPATPRAVELLIKKINGLGNDLVKIACIEQSIVNNRQDIFPLREEKKPYKTDNQIRYEQKRQQATPPDSFIQY